MNNFFKEKVTSPVYLKSRENHPTQINQSTIVLQFTQALLT